MKLEPNADSRLIATILWQMYIALTAEGFSDGQALTIIGNFINANTKDEK